MSLSDKAIELLKAHEKNLKEAEKIVKKQIKEELGIDIKFIKPKIFGDLK